MKISVIIPTYKPQEYLWECLDSLVSQTFSKNDFEIVLILNGCAEPWKREIEHYISTKMRGTNVNFIHTEQGGVSNARNLGIEASRGEYITFIDDDDYVSPQYLDGLYKKASLDIISVCYPFAFHDGRNDFQLDSYGLTQLYENAFVDGPFSFHKIRQYFSGPCMKLFHRNIISDRRFDVRFKNGEDALFMFLISDKFNKVVFTDKNSIYYRRYRANSAYTSKQKKSYVIKNECKRIVEYSKIYFSNIHKYSSGFYLTRILGAIKTIFLGVFKKYIVYGISSYSN